MYWQCAGNKPLPKLMMISSLVKISITRPQCINHSYCCTYILVINLVKYKKTSTSHIFQACFLSMAEIGLCQWEKTLHMCEFRSSCSAWKELTLIITVLVTPHSFSLNCMITLCVLPKCYPCLLWLLENCIKIHVCWQGFSNVVSNLLANIGSGNGLSPGGCKPLPEPISTCHQSDSVAFDWLISQEVL